MEFQLPDYNIQVMLPEIFLFVWALVIFAVDVVTKRKSESLVGYLTLLGLVITGILMAFTKYGIAAGMESVGFGSMFVNDEMSYFFKIIFLSAAFMAVC